MSKLTEFSDLCNSYCFDWHLGKTQSGSYYIAIRDKYNGTNKPTVHLRRGGILSANKALKKGLKFMRKFHLAYTLGNIKEND